jgi:hypothetical protein
MSLFKLRGELGYTHRIVLAVLGGLITLTIWWGFWRKPCPPSARSWKAGCVSCLLFGHYHHKSSAGFYPSSGFLAYRQGQLL